MCSQILWQKFGEETHVFVMVRSSQTFHNMRCNFITGEILIHNYQKYYKHYWLVPVLKCRPQTSCLFSAENSGIKCCMVTAYNCTLFNKLEHEILLRLTLMMTGLCFKNQWSSSQNNKSMNIAVYLLHVCNCTLQYI